MIKKIIENLKKIYIESTTEEIYIRGIISIQKEYWYQNMNQESVFIGTLKHLNRLKLSQERHPFLVEFRDNMNKLFETNQEFNKDEANKLFNSLYRYKEELLKKKLN